MGGDGGAGGAGETRHRHRQAPAGPCVPALRGDHSPQLADPYSLVQVVLVSGGVEWRAGDRGQLNLAPGRAAVQCWASAASPAPVLALFLGAVN